MDQLDLARIQFATTSIYHFFFVPVTMGLAILVAVLHTRWHRGGNPEMRRLTRFFGTLMLISISVGVVTGLVQEFQFGMDWSAYSRFVGDVFGAPLAMEGLAAFFLESTFLGLWLFGWNVLPRGAAPVHRVDGPGRAPACRRCSSSRRTPGCRTPAGTRSTRTTGRAELTSDRRRLHQSGVPVGLRARAAGRADLRRGGDAGGVRLAPATRATRPSCSAAPPSWAFSCSRSRRCCSSRSAAGSASTRPTYQPMKIAAAEANWDTCQPCSFSVFQIGGYNQDETPTKIIEIPHLLSVLATGTWDGEVQGLSARSTTQYNEQYGPGYYVPNVFIQYWSMRVMAYLARRWFRDRAVGCVCCCGARSSTPPGSSCGCATWTDPDAVRDGHRRMAAHRERPATVDRAGPDADQGRPVRFGQRHPGGDQPGHRGGAVLHARRHRRGADGPARPPGTAATNPTPIPTTPDAVSGADRPTPSLTY